MSGSIVSDDDLSSVPDSQSFEITPAASVEATAPSSPSSSLGKSAVMGELLGRGGIYSFSYDYNIIPNIAAGAGIGLFSQSDGETSATVTFIPVYANIYVLTGSHRPFGTIGVTFVNATVSDEDDTFSGNGNFSTLGLGYEFRSAGGFAMRLAAYRLSGGGESTFWPGLSFGGSF